MSAAPAISLTPAINPTVLFQFNDVLKRIKTHSSDLKIPTVCYQDFPICGLLFGEPTSNSPDQGTSSIRITSFLQLSITNVQKYQSSLVEIFKEASSIQSQASKCMRTRELLMGIVVLDNFTQQKLGSLTFEDIIRVINSCNEFHLDFYITRNPDLEYIKKIFYCFVLTQKGFPYELRVINSETMVESISAYEIGYSNLDSEMYFLEQLEREGLLRILSSEDISLEDKRRTLIESSKREPDQQIEHIAPFRDDPQIIKLFNEAERCTELARLLVGKWIAD